MNYSAVCGKEDPIRANHYLLTALKLSPQATGPDGEEIEFPEDLKPEWLFWSNAEGIKSANDLRDWMSTIEQLTPEQRECIFGGSDGEEGSMALADKLWIRESDKPKEAQQWSHVADALDELTIWARKLGLEVLWACAVRAKMIVAAEYKGSLEMAKTLAESALAEASPDPRVRFLIKDSLGRQYWYAKQSVPALLWLDDAQTEKMSAFPIVRIDGLLSASCAIGDSDPEKAIRYAEGAVEIAKSSNASKKQTIRAMGELVVAQLLAGRDLAAVFTVWDEAADRLFTDKRDTDSWKQLFVIFAHVSGYLSHLATWGKPPTENMDGEAYGSPRRGGFLIHNQAVTKLYDPMKEVLLKSQLAMFADAVKNDERAVYWGLQGIDTARERKQDIVVPSFGLILIPYLLKNNRYTEALDLALEVSAIVVAGSKQKKTGGKELPFGPGELDVGSLLGAKPNDSWREVEALSLVMGLLPIAFRISNVALTDIKASSSSAVEVVEACRKISESASENDLWTSAADLIELAFVYRISGRDLIRMANRFGDETLRMIAYVGASLRGDLTLQAACEAHLTVIYHAYKSLGSRYTVYRQIVVPFVSEYWMKTLLDRHSESIPPTAVAREIASIPSIPDDRRAQAILRIAARDLRASITQSQREWLSP